MGDLFLVFYFCSRYFDSHSNSNQIIDYFEISYFWVWAPSSALSHMENQHTFRPSSSSSVCKNQSTLYVLVKLWWSYQVWKHPFSRAIRMFANVCQNWQFFNKISVVEFNPIPYQKHLNSPFLVNYHRKVRISIPIQTQVSVLAREWIKKSFFGGRAPF